MRFKSHLTPTNQLPLVVIVGPTASGKTGLAIELAKRHDGEIICADSRSIYKGADIGTAKPSPKEQAAVPHWGLNLVNPGEYFSVADFKEYADKKIAEIRTRGKVPFLVGGTGLYVDAVIFDYQFGPPANIPLRTKLQQMNVDELQNYCKKSGIALPENYNNRRYLVRAVECNGLDNRKYERPLENSIIVGITTEKQILVSRIAERAEQLFDDGVVNEARSLSERFGWDNEAMKSNIYPLIHKYLDGQMTLDDVKGKYITLDWRLAKRQLTWLRRNSFIHWLSLEGAKKYLNHELAIRKQP
jgi:tRNA dimethylallyltransferase